MKFLQNLKCSRPKIPPKKHLINIALTSSLFSFLFHPAGIFSDWHYKLLGLVRHKLMQNRKDINSDVFVKIYEYGKDEIQVIRSGQKCKYT
jgi:hypothetical protein